MLDFSDSLPEAIKSQDTGTETEIIECFTFSVSGMIEFSTALISLYQGKAAFMISAEMLDPFL